VAGFIES